MNYENILLSVPLNASILYLKVPSSKINYIEIPQIIELTRIDNKSFYSPTLEMNRPIENLLSNFSKGNNTILFAPDEKTLKKAFINYYQDYVVALREELDFLVEAIPNLKNTAYLKELV